TFRYFASTYDCRACPLKSKCCPNTPQRKIPRDINEDARDQARALYGTAAFDKSRNDRKKVEMRFAHLKTHHRFERMRLRGLSGARRVPPRGNRAKPQDACKLPLARMLRSMRSRLGCPMVTPVRHQVTVRVGANRKCVGRRNGKLAPNLTA